MNRYKKYFFGWLLIPFTAVILNYSIYVIGMGGLGLQIIYCAPISKLKNPYFIYDPAVGWLPTYKALILATIVYSLIYVVCILLFELIKGSKKRV